MRSAIFAALVAVIECVKCPVGFEAPAGAASCCPAGTAGGSPAYAMQVTGTCLHPVTSATECARAAKYVMLTQGGVAEDDL